MLNEYYRHRTGHRTATAIPPHDHWSLRAPVSKAVFGAVPRALCPRWGARSSPSLFFIYGGCRGPAKLRRSFPAFYPPPCVFASDSLLRPPGFLFAFPPQKQGSGGGEKPPAILPPLRPAAKQPPAPAIPPVCSAT